jgi:hypothetical protein
MRHLIVILCLVLASCTTTPPAGITKVPVPVECREQIPDRPAMPSEALVSAQPLDGFVAALLAEVDLREGYEIRLLTALQGCTKPIASTSPSTPTTAPAPAARPP